MQDFLTNDIQIGDFVLIAKRARDLTLCLVAERITDDRIKVIYNKVQRRWRRMQGEPGGQNGGYQVKAVMASEKVLTKDVIKVQPPVNFRIKITSPWYMVREGNQQLKDELERTGFASLLQKRDEVLQKLYEQSQKADTTTV